MFAAWLGIGSVAKVTKVENHMLSPIRDHHGTKNTLPLIVTFKYIASNYDELCLYLSREKHYECTVPHIHPTSQPVCRAPKQGGSNFITPFWIICSLAYKSRVLRQVAGHKAPYSEWSNVPNGQCPCGRAPHSSISRCLDGHLNLLLSYHGQNFFKKLTP